MNKRLKVWWDGDNKYFTGTVVEYKYPLPWIQYDDGDLKKHDLLTPGVETFLVV